MVVAVKSALVIFILLGFALVAGGAWEIWNTVSLLSASSGKAKARFAGYDRVRSQVAPGVSLRGSGIPSISHYPEFIYKAEDGSLQKVREEKVHVLEIYKPDQEVDILLFPHVKPVIDSFYSLYVRDLVILLAGLVLQILVLSFWRYALPLLSSPGSAAPGGHSAQATSVADQAKESFNRYLDGKIGPVSLRSIAAASSAFMGLMLIGALFAWLAPYFSNLGFGAGSRLREAIKEERFEEARLMIEKGAGIHTVDEFDQNPLLLSLEAGRMDLAAMLISAGADVNIRSKMLISTPLRAAVEAGNLEMVKLLLAKGAQPQHPDDRAPPFFYALAKGHDEIARVLIEAGTDLHRGYPLQGGTGTVGDFAVLAGRQELVELIRRRGGTFAPQGAPK